MLSRVMPALWSTSISLAPVHVALDIAPTSQSRPFTAGENYDHTRKGMKQKRNKIRNIQTLPKQNEIKTQKQKQNKKRIEPNTNKTKQNETKRNRSPLHTFPDAHEL
jgi:hypothetical protein